MKKITIALSGFLLLSLGSCEKEEIKPNQHQNDVERSIIIDNSGDEKANNNNNKSSFSDKKTSDTIIRITDPNRDEDDERKIKRKN